MAPSQRQLRFWEIYVALMKLVFSRATVSFSPRMQKPSSSSSIRLVMRELSLVTKSKSFPRSEMPFTNQEEPSMMAQSALECRVGACFFLIILAILSLRLVLTRLHFLVEPSTWHLSPLNQLTGTVVSIDTQVSLLFRYMGSEQEMSFSQQIYLQFWLSSILSSSMVQSSSSSSSSYLCFFLSLLFYLAFLWIYLSTSVVMQCCAPVFSDYRSSCFSSLSYRQQLQQVRTATTRQRYFSGFINNTNIILDIGKISQMGKHSIEDRLAHVADFGTLLGNPQIPHLPQHLHALARVHLQVVLVAAPRLPPHLQHRPLPDLGLPPQEGLLLTAPMQVA